MLWFIIVCGYLVGSIPTAYIAGRLLKKTDIRQMGDGNAGARNAYHNLGAKAGLGIFVIDAAKGVLIILIAKAAELPQPAMLAAGAFTVVGHTFPVYIGFKGGRGESTSIGVLAAVVTIPMLILALPTIATLYFKKNVYWASVVMFVPLPFLCWWMGFSLVLIIYSLTLPIMVGLTTWLRERQRAIRNV